jgi:hypothetical protein
MWSYSSLREATECPRRWSLLRGSYPDVWERNGYPPRPGLAALIGDVVHHILEIVLRDLFAAGCESPSDGSAVEVLRRLGGYSKLIETAIGSRVKRLEDNPRMAGRREAIRVALSARAPEIRQQVQSMISRVAFEAARGAGTSPTGTPSGGRSPLRVGSHSEVELCAAELRFAGRADLLTVSVDGCVITDFKTGAPNPHHREQLLTYALLWRADTERNARAVPVVRGILVYATHEELVEPASLTELDALAADIQGRIERAETDIAMRPPPARPAQSICGWCSVRHLCDPYWGALSPGAAVAATRAGTIFADCEGVLLRPNGPRSWILRLEPEHIEVLLRTPTEAPCFDAGDRVRLLNVACGYEGDSNQVIATITQGSEAFKVRP